MELRLEPDYLRSIEEFRESLEPGFDMGGYLVGDKKENQRSLEFVQDQVYISSICKFIH